MPESCSTEASISKEVLIDAGIPAVDILLEELSWNTHENAHYTAALIRSNTPDASILLVTSAFHMDRAMRCFAKEGISPEAYPVDYISGGEVCRGIGCVLPSIRVFIDWQIPIKEKVGLLVYGMKGYV